MTFKAIPLLLLPALMLLVGCGEGSEPSSPPTPIPGVPHTSASAVTSPPPSMEGINIHTEMYGTGADPNIITLGPKVGGHPDSDPYSNKTSMEFELKHGVPVLAPIDMVFIGFKNRNAKYRIRLVDGSSANQLPDGQNKIYIMNFNSIIGQTLISTSIPLSSNSLMEHLKKLPLRFP